MLKKDLINGIILIIFSALMHESLTFVTQAFVVVGVLLIWFQLRPGKIVRNGLALAVFGSYWFTYGKVIDPEIGLNFLTSIIVIKLLERETERDDYMIFYGLILIVSTGSLFVKNLAYLGFFIISFFTLIILFYYQLGLKLKFSQFLKNILWITPITLFFFFLVPRLMSPIPLNSAPVRAGEVGYRPDVNLSEIDSLNLSSESVFEVQIESKVSQKDLYWRGNTLSFTDGWNWPLMSQDRSSMNKFTNEKPHEGLKQQIRLHGQFQFFFGLDRPLWIKTNQGFFQLNSKYSAEQSQTHRSQSYEVISRLDQLPLHEELSVQMYLRKGLSKFEREWIDKTFSNNKLPELIKEIEVYFEKNNFTYSLSPGKIQNFQEFMEKKTGFCSHFASALALILRVKGVPTRLVSGFHGGIYNPYSQTYTIAQNDAHVWVESLRDGYWIRVDPTLWIAPDRIQLGGEAYLQKVSGRGLNWDKIPFSNQLKEISLWLNQWDFKFYNWIENLDYHQQLIILKRLNIKREYLFSIIPLLVLFSIILIILKQKFQFNRKSEIEKLWILFRSKNAKYNIEVDYRSISEIEKLFDKLPTSEVKKLKGILHDLTLLTFAEDNSIKIKTIRRKIKSL